MLEINCPMICWKMMVKTLNVINYTLLSILDWFFISGQLSPRACSRGLVLAIPDQIR